MIAPPKVIDRRSKKKPALPSVTFSGEFIGCFVRMCTGGLLGRVVKTYHPDADNELCYGDRLFFEPIKYKVYVHRVEIIGTLEDEPDNRTDMATELHTVGSRPEKLRSAVLWVPSQKRLEMARQRELDEFCDELAGTYAINSEGTQNWYPQLFPRLPAYITEHEAYIRACEQVIREANIYRRGPAVGLMQVDPERLSPEVQALTVESLLTNV